jgi:thiol:disulfide interchange protein
VEAANTELSAGEKGVVQVTVRVPAEHHLYRDMMAVSVVSAEGLKVGEASFPPGHSKPDPADPTATREQYDMDVVIEVAVTAPESVGEYPVTFEVRYQGCKKSLCWMPQTESVEATVRVAGAKK